jgi:hypothetical protein
MSFISFMSGARELVRYWKVASMIRVERGHSTLSAVIIVLICWYIFATCLPRCSGIEEKNPFLRYDISQRLMQLLYYCKSIRNRGGTLAITDSARAHKKNPSRRNGNGGEREKCPIGCYVSQTCKWRAQII